MSLRPYIQRLTPWLTAYLLLVSVGLPLQRVYCACVGEQWLAVLPAEHQCHHGAPAVETDIHHHARKTSCHGPNNTPEKSSCQGHAGQGDTESCASHSCGDSETLIAQLDADFPLEDKAPAADFGLLPPHFAPDAWPPRPVITAATPIRGPTPPPPPAGRALLVVQQTFLI